MSQSRQQSLCQGVCSSTPRRRASRPFCTRAISSPPEPPSLLARYPILVRHVDYWSHYSVLLQSRTRYIHTQTSPSYSYPHCFEYHHRHLCRGCLPNRETTHRSPLTTAKEFSHWHLLNSAYCQPKVRFSESLHRAGDSSLPGELRLLLSLADSSLCYL